MFKKALILVMGLLFAISVSGCSSEKDLLNASITGNAEKIKKNLADKIDINAVDANGATPLYLAIENNHEEVVKLLIENAANINVTNRTDGNTPLHIAIMKSEFPILKVLVQNGALLDIKNNKDETSFTVRDNKGKTILNQVAAAGDLDLIQKLLDKMPPANKEESEKHPLNIPDNLDNTPLHTALILRHKALAKILIDKGAMLEFKNSKGEDAITIANGLKMYDILSFLFLKSGDLDNAITNTELALKTDANNPDLLYNYATALLLKGEKYNNGGKLSEAKNFYIQSISNFVKVITIKSGFKDTNQLKELCESALRNIEAELEKQEQERQKVEAAKKAKEAAASQSISSEKLRRQQQEIILDAQRRIGDMIRSYYR